MTRDLDRRDFLGMLAAGALPFAGLGSWAASIPSRSRALRVRTITAGLELTRLTDLSRVEAAIDRLERARKTFQAEDYEVQTLRIATQPILAGSDERARESALPQLRALDQLVGARDVRISIGPVLTADRPEPRFPSWAAELARTTKNLNFTVAVATPERGAVREAAAVAAATIAALARATPGGMGNFRFAAAANVPAGTPFFPVAYHRGPDSLAIGLESATLVGEAFEERTPADSAVRLQHRLEEALLPVEKIAGAVARRERCVYLGIDPSPAPGLDRSIGASIEALTGVPFGGSSTLDACAAVTGALKAARIRSCGYAGLMLPVLEDPVLARRATEGRYGVGELLLYSSVCGTGLDVVPIPGDTPVEVMTRLIRDVAALAVRLRKPLSARLFPIPGRRAGEMARFDDPYLTDCAVLTVS